ncbi:hypothetical protein [Hamadaea tsunoensis]|uniref:hypothetical protein n=1 Tax=Hamadaea tsunoensis TaxID=53368 RepID=UPI000423BF77|nr:hypothetical protein [Hamadaea tsunoensis]
MAGRRGRLALALAEAGVWRSADPEERERQFAAVLSGDYPLNLPVFDDVTFPADGEALTEGGVEKLLDAMTPALAEHGLALRVRRLRRDEHDYVIDVNGRFCRIRTAGEQGRAATVRPLAIVNDLLAAAGTPLRVFTLYAGGSEGLALLLDPRVVRAMKLSGLYDRRELPELAAV